MAGYKRRQKLTRKKSRKNFRKGVRVKKKNNRSSPMRGGIRM